MKHVKLFEQSISEARRANTMKRFVIRNTETGEFRKGTGKNGEWTTYNKADLYKTGKSSAWWFKPNMEFVEVTITI